MKKAINQKVRTNNEIKNSYVVVVTRKSNTFCYTFETFESALDEYCEKVKEESRFSSIVNTKTIIGLYDVTDYGKTIRICNQTKTEANRFF